MRDFGLSCLAPRHATPAPGGSALTAQGQPRARFRRAIQRKNLLGAETCAREMGVVSLDEALDLVALVLEVAPDRLDGYARRFLVRLAEERMLGLAKLDLAVTALRALPSPRARDACASSLLDL